MNTEMGSFKTECEHLAISMIFTEGKVSEGRSCKLYSVKNYINDTEYFEKSSMA
jgi:hypothetical protein